jgi:hypothetical protein
MTRGRDAKRGLIAAALVALSLLAVFAIELSDTQANSKQALEARVHERAVLAAALIDSLIQTVGQQVPQDVKEFGARNVTARTMDRNGQGDEYVVLLGPRGEVIAASRGFTAQARAGLATSAALALVRAGHPYGVGNIVPYDGTGAIELAVAFPTPFGARTLLTGFGPTALDAFIAGELSRIPGVKGAQNYLIDGNDTVIASTNPARPAGYVFRQRAQVQALAHSSGDRNGSFFDQVPLANSTWGFCSPHPTGRCSRALRACTSGCRGRSSWRSRWSRLRRSCSAAGWSTRPSRCVSQMCSWRTRVKRRIASWRR